MHNPSKVKHGSKEWYFETQAENQNQCDNEIEVLLTGQRGNLSAIAQMKQNI